MKKLIAVVIFAMLAVPAEAGLVKVASFPVRHPKKLAKGAGSAVKHLVKGAKRVIW